MKKIELKDLFDKSGAVIIRCGNEWGGTYGYKNRVDSNSSVCGYRTENSAIKGWFDCAFSGNKEMFKMIKYLISRANRSCKTKHKK